MPFIVDGHNLIPALAGIELQDLEDEEHLMRVLQRFSRSRGSMVEVYYDRAAPGTPPKKRAGRVTAVFVRKPLTADDAIRLRLQKLGKAARNWTVISSDRQVQAEARARGARVLSSEQFATELEAVSSQVETGISEDSPMEPKELQSWLELFADTGPSEQEDEDG